MLTIAPCDAEQKQLQQDKQQKQSLHWKYLCCIMQGESIGKIGPWLTGYLGS